MKKTPRYQEIENIHLPLYYEPEAVRSAITYKPEDNEIVVASYPHCGGTWVSQIVLLILRKGYPCTSSDQFFDSNPLLELVGTDKLKNATWPLCLRTHLDFHRLNYSKNAKYIWVVRHIEDCVVSFYYHTRAIPAFFFTNGEFDDFLELFVKEDVEYNSYMKHFYSWWYHRTYKNVFYLTYESIQADLRKAILEIAGFLGQEYVEELNASGEKVLKKIMFYSSMSYMNSTIKEYKKEIFTDKLLSEEYQIKLHVTKKYTQIFKEAEKDSHYFFKNADVYEEISLTKEQVEKINQYIRGYVDPDRYWLTSYLIGKEITFNYIKSNNKLYRLT